MNRVYPLREGSGECIALVRFDAGEMQEFRRSSEKITREIISLLKTLSLLRHSLKLRLCGNCPSEKIQEDRERRDTSTAGVRDIEVLVLQAGAHHADVRLCANAPRELGAVGGEVTGRHQ